MPIPDARARRYLAHMGIQVWGRRDRGDAAGPATADRRAGDADERLRIRLASGDGAWLLVQRQPWTGVHESLLADLTATLGASDCRFGQWTVSDSAGIGVEQLSERGVRQVLSFGKPPREVNSDAVHVAPELDELAVSAEARRRMWHLLAPLVTG